jgi:hypothetical protein
MVSVKGSTRSPEFTKSLSAGNSERKLSACLSHLSVEHSSSLRAAGECCQHSDLTSSTREVSFTNSFGDEPLSCNYTYTYTYRSGTPSLLSFGSIMPVQTTNGRTCNNTCQRRKEAQVGPPLYLSFLLQLAFYRSRRCYSATIETTLDRYLSGMFCSQKKFKGFEVPFVQRT